MEKDHPVPPPTVITSKASSPSSFGDDHLGPDLVELHPQVLVLEPDLDVLVVSRSGVLASVET